MLSRPVATESERTPWKITKWVKARRYLDRRARNRDSSDEGEARSMAWHQFAIRLMVAFILGGFVGAERQWRQRNAGLRTNCLVAVGSAMFVMMGGLIGGADGSQGRVAAYIVSGIGFIGGGVILKEGFTIRGLNTAATLWCTAAIGSLAGLGYTLLCVLGTVAVLAANLLLRPLATKINRTPVQAMEEIVLYLFECVCRNSDEGQIRALLVQNIGHTALVLYALHSEDEEGTSRVRVRARVKSVGRKDDLLEQIVTRLSLEPGVTTIRWEIVSDLDVETQAIGGHVIDEESRV